MRRLTLQAYAKINLHLRVLGRRPDGYHEIESVAQTISLHDTLDLVEAPELRLTVAPPDLPGDRNNLVWMAAAARLKEVGEPGVEAHLRKRIPIGAGLGGGSSDAAATLIGLSRLFGGDLEAAALHALAERLGSDVPLFLIGGTVRIQGRGTEVAPLPDLAPRPMVLVHPGVAISTREIYAQVQEPLTPRAKTGSISRFENVPEGALEDWVRLGNDLEPIAIRFCPAIREIKERLLCAGASAAAMTGSGSAVFGIFEAADRSAKVAGEMERHGWRAWTCVPVSRVAYRRGLGLL